MGTTPLQYSCRVCENCNYVRCANRLGISKEEDKHCHRREFKACVGKTNAVFLAHMVVKFTYHFQWYELPLLVCVCVCVLGSQKPQIKMMAGFRSHYMNTVASNGGLINGELSFPLNTWWPVASHFYINSWAAKSLWLLYCSFLSPMCAPTISLWLQRYHAVSLGHEYSREKRDHVEPAFPKNQVFVYTLVVASLLLQLD